MPFYLNRKRVGTRREEGATLEPIAHTLRLARRASRRAMRSRISSTSGRLHPVLQAAEKWLLMERLFYFFVLIETADRFLHVQLRRRFHHRNLTSVVRRNQPHRADDVELLDFIIVEIGYNEAIIAMQRRDKLREVVI